MNQDFRKLVSSHVERFIADSLNVEVSTSTHWPQSECGHLFPEIRQFLTLFEALAFLRERAADPSTTLLYLNVRDLAPWQLLHDGYREGQLSSLRPLCEVKRSPGDALAKLRNSVRCYVRIGHGDARLDYESEEVFETFEAALLRYKEVLADPHVCTASLYLESPLLGEENLRICKGSASFVPGSM